MKDAEFDVVVYGASGFTGRLVAEHLVQRTVAPKLRWAMAGRDLEKLATVRDEIRAPADTPLIAAAADDAGALRGMVARTKVVITTVGPYQLYGDQLVAACAAVGTDYLDLCGEPAWMRRMIDRHEAEAKASGARILFSCGFDSIPFELGVLFLQDATKSKFGVPASRIKGRVRAFRGLVSGGSLASMKATLEAARDEQTVALLKDPFALTPGFRGPPQPEGGLQARYDEDLGSWNAPWVMEVINTRNVHRSNHLQGHPYGQDFLYDERVLTGPGAEGEARAKAMAAASSPLADPKAPKPGEGPSREEREAGFYELIFVGVTKDGRKLSALVRGDRDPGYGSTSKIIVETAAHFLQHGGAVRGGIWTPGAALGRGLIEPLTRYAGLGFQLLEE
ncbi:saccharopine dehydrogenase family protein [Hyalangium versicolor]|uniref:saccharopine dehydrogenase family protein n=1 Tax=Hyalangium versicolor TaxID=2861190 RepID=UPI001CCC72A5|nr:saccharopine dehydrogenase NADP-binding domain-containing protein [Hyalangium versicolor]